MIDAIFITAWLCICAYWVYVHTNFKRALKLHEPQILRSNADWSPYKRITGSGYVDFALTGRYKLSKHATVIVAGNRLVNAYDVKFKAIGYGLSLSSLWFATVLCIGRYQ